MRTPSAEALQLDWDFIEHMLPKNRIAYLRQCWWCGTTRPLNELFKRFKPRVLFVGLVLHILSSIMAIRPFEGAQERASEFDPCICKMGVCASHMNIPNKQMIGACLYSTVMLS